MKQSLITLIFLIATVLNAQLNDISTFKFVWDTYPTVGHISGTHDYLHPDLVRWNDDKITYNIPIKLWSFNTEDDIPSELAGKENDLEPLLTNAIAEWNNNYEIKMEIDNNEDNGVWIGFSNNPEDFITPDGDYAAGVTRIPVFLNGYDAQFEMYELLDTSETLTIYHGLDVYFFSNNSLAPTWTTSTTPDNEKTMLGTVMLHEMGHVLSMGHSEMSYPPRIMDKQYDPKVLSASLTDGDKSNASYHYRQLYEIRNGTYIEGDVAFSPLPGTYGVGQVIEMTNKTSNGDYIVFNLGYSTVSREDAASWTPDITKDNFQFAVSLDPNKLKMTWEGYHYYFKAALYDSNEKIILGKQTEGSYYIDNTVGIDNDASVELSSFPFEIEQNNVYSSTAIFHPDPDVPTSYAWNWDWTLKLFHDNGEYILDHKYIEDYDHFYGDTWEATVGSLPSGYNWNFNLAGNKIYGEIVVSVNNGDIVVSRDIFCQLTTPSIPTGFSVSGATGEHPVLSWDLNTEPDIYKYNIYEDNGNGMQFLTSVNHPTNQLTYSGITIGGKFDPQFCFTITAKNTSGLESDQALPKCVNAGTVSKRLFAKESNSIPKEYKLSDSYPNPFNPSTNIEFQLPKDANVVVKVYDIQGNEVQKLVNEYLSAGYYSVLFDGSNLSSGVYIYTIQMNDFHSIKKMMLIK